MALRYITGRSGQGKTEQSGSDPPPEREIGRAHV